ncbi:hypothetical protein WJX72_011328 [[Myrmecia] bisecta]|uniref:Uncharacterized protein n=1 Tax=[Myrmecia] bisecta TaxID=41462 RepID=A0AAW1PMM0_9CHLO
MGSKKHKKATSTTPSDVVAPSNGNTTSNGAYGSIKQEPESQAVLQIKENGFHPVPRGKAVAPLPTAIVESQLASMQKQLQNTERELHEKEKQVESLEQKLTSLEEAHKAEQSSWQKQQDELRALLLSSQDALAGLQAQVQKLTQQLDAANASSGQAWLYAYLTSASAVACMGVATFAVMRCRQ